MYVRSHGNCTGSTGLLCTSVGSPWAKNSEVRAPIFSQDHLCKCLYIQYYIYLLLCGKQESHEGAGLRTSMGRVCPQLYVCARHLTSLSEDGAETRIFLEKVHMKPYLVSSPKVFKRLQSTSSTSQYLFSQVQSPPLKFGPQRTGTFAVAELVEC